MPKLKVPNVVLPPLVVPATQDLTGGADAHRRGADVGAANARQRQQHAGDGGRVMFTGDGHGDGIAVRTGRRGGACRRYRAVDDQRYRRTGAGAGQQAGGAVPRYGVGAVW